ncbi:MAG TPA: PfkB family carbohydrate kinase [Gammaproteobacteria bacterium]
MKYVARILAVGNATLDIINVVDGYPAEDTEVRASAQQIRRGGNAANTLVALSQLGHSCSWAGTLAAEPDGSLILADLARHRIDSSAVRSVTHGKVPTSYVTLNRRNGSRTIVHYRDLPEYHHNDFTQIDLAEFAWLHFEGRNIEEVRPMMERARNIRPELPVSLEVEKVRPGIENLFPLASLLLFSKEFARHSGHPEACSFLRALHDNSGIAAQLVCAWGELGAYALDGEGHCHHAPAHPPLQVVDTLGAGDVFNAGVIDGLVRGETLAAALHGATRLAGRKCGIYGLEGLAR